MKVENAVVIEFSIRNYQSSDLTVCRQLYEQLTQHHGKIYGDPSMGGPDAGLGFDRHLQRAGFERVWVAECAAGVVGLVSLLVEEQEAELEPIVVLPQYRGQGIGRALLKHAIDQARKLEVPLLCVKPVARNVEALSFFRQGGFGVVGHVQLFMDLGTIPLGTWKPGLDILGHSFEY